MTYAKSRDWADFSVLSFLPTEDLVCYTLKVCYCTAEEKSHLCGNCSVCCRGWRAQTIPNVHSSSGTHPSLQEQDCLLALSQKWCFVQTAAEQDEFQYLSLACVVLAVISCWYSISGGETPQWDSRNRSVLNCFFLYACWN